MLTYGEKIHHVLPLKNILFQKSFLHEKEEEAFYISTVKWYNFVPRLQQWATAAMVMILLSNGFFFEVTSSKKIHQVAQPFR